MASALRQIYLDPDKISKGDVIMFASVGAGMNVNAITYQV